MTQTGVPALRAAPGKEGEMDGGLILTRNLLIVREGEVVGHLSKLQVLKCADGTEETEVVLHLLEPQEPGAPTFHAWREAGEGLKPEKRENPRHLRGDSEIEAYCYEKTCVHCPNKNDEDDAEPCYNADLRGGLTLGDSWIGTWRRYNIEDESEIACGSYERADEKDPDDEAEDDEDRRLREFREAEEAGQMALTL